MAHMSEKEWASFALDKNLDPTTGKKWQEQTDDQLAWESDVRKILDHLRHLHEDHSRTQTMLVVGFIGLIILHFFHAPI